MRRRPTRSPIAAAAFATSVAAFLAFAPGARGQAAPDPLAGWTSRSFDLGLGVSGPIPLVDTEGGRRENFLRALPLAAGVCETHLLESRQPWPREWGSFFAQPELPRRKARWAAEFGRYGLAPVVRLTPFQSVAQAGGKPDLLNVARPQGMSPTAGFDSPRFRDAWNAHVARVASEFVPPRIVFGERIGATANRAELEPLATLFAEAADAVRAASPGTRVGVEFDYEALLEHGLLDLIDAPEWNADFVAVETRPPGGEAPPAGYFDELFARAGRPVAFLNLGRATPGIPDEPSPDPEENTARIQATAKREGEAQLRFLSGFLEAIRDRDVELVHWVRLHDAERYGRASRTENHAGLRDSFGRPKPAWDVWERLAALPIEPRPALE